MFFVNLKMSCRGVAYSACKKPLCTRVKRSVNGRKRHCRVTHGKRKTTSKSKKSNKSKKSTKPTRRTRNTRLAKLDFLDEVKHSPLPAPFPELIRKVNEPQNPAKAVKMNEPQISTEANPQIRMNKSAPVPQPLKNITDVSDVLPPSLAETLNALAEEVKNMPRRRYAFMRRLKQMKLDEFNTQCMFATKKSLAKGSDGETFLSHDNPPRVIKVIKYQPEYGSLRQFVTSAYYEAVAGKMAGEYGFGPKLYDFFFCSKNKTLQAVFYQEFFEQDIYEGFIRQCSRGCSNEDSLKLIAAAARTMQNMHNHGITHMDAHPANVFLVRNRNQIDVKFIDFGRSLLFDPTKSEDKAAFFQARVYDTTVFILRFARRVYIASKRNTLANTNLADYVRAAKTFFSVYNNKDVQSATMKFIEKNKDFKDHDEYEQEQKQVIGLNCKNFSVVLNSWRHKDKDGEYHPASLKGSYNAILGYCDRVNQDPFDYDRTWDP